VDLRVPPQNIEAEQSVLGGLMLDPESWDAVSDILTEEDFYKSSHRVIFKAIADLQKKNQPIDIITVSNWLTEKKELDAAGGASYLAEVINQTPSSANIGTYSKIVHDKALARKLINTASKCIEKAYQQDYEDVDSFLDSVETDIFQVIDNKKVSGLTPASDIVRGSLEKIEQLYHQKAEVTGISTGFAELDKMTAGFHPGELTIIAARPSMGKTALSLSIAQSVAIKQRAKLAYFSVEMAKEQMMMRILASEARISLSDIRVGRVNDTAWPKLIATAAKVSEAPLYIDDTSGISPFEIRAKARRLKAQHGLDIIMIDYLQIMDLKQKVESRERAVSEISRTLKSIAKELSIPVIALAQLNRGVEGRGDKRPMLSDLRESGSIEQDADVIMMIFREGYYDRDNPDAQQEAELIIGKQRNGPTGTVKLKWESKFGKFSDYDYSTQPQSPLPPPPPPPQHPGQRPRNFAPGANAG
jgi:replicative DNA helicase